MRIKLRVSIRVWFMLVKYEGKGKSGGLSLRLKLKYSFG